MFRRFGIIAAVASVNPFLESVFLERYRKFRARYGFDNNEIPVRSDIKQRFQEVLDDLNLSNEYRERIKLFNAYDVNVFRAGNVHSKYGAVIGVPVNFEYTDADSLDEHTVSLQSVPLGQYPRASKEFRKSLVLSEDAQKFAIAQEVLATTHIISKFKTLNKILDVIMGIVIYDILSITFNKNKQRSKSIFLMGIVAFGTYISYAYTTNALDNYYEDKINKEITELGPKYIKGGVEYYEKLLNRHKALRVLLGDRGKYEFKTTGDKVYWFNQGRVPISEQKHYFDTELQNI